MPAMAQKLAADTPGFRGIWKLQQNQRRKQVLGGGKVNLAVGLLARLFLASTDDADAKAPKFGLIVFTNLSKNTSSNLCADKPIRLNARGIHPEMESDWSALDPTNKCRCVG